MLAEVVLLTHLSKIGFVILNNVHKNTQNLFLRLNQPASLESLGIDTDLETLDEAELLLLLLAE